MRKIVFKASVIFSLILISLIFSARAFAVYEISDGTVVGLYHFDSTATDSSGNGNTVSLTGTSSYVLGKFNGAMDTGVAGYGTIAITTTPLKHGVAMWVKVPVVSGVPYFIDYGANTCVFNEFASYGGHTLALQTYNGNNIWGYDGSLADSLWHFLVVNYNGAGNDEIWYDGTKQVTANAGGSSCNGAQITLGAYNGGASSWLTGSMDEVVLRSNAVFSPTDIAAMWASGDGATVCTTVGCGATGPGPGPGIASTTAGAITIPTVWGLSALAIVMITVFFYFAIFFFIFFMIAWGLVFVLQPIHRILTWWK